MPIPSKYLADLTEGNTYHLYNHTNNNELLFHTDHDRHFFLKRFDDYLTPFLDTFCWSLLPDHFHWLVRIKSPSLIKDHLANLKYETLSAIEREYLDLNVTSEKLIENTAKRFFASYAIHFNHMHERHGNLFHRPFKRMEIVPETQLIKSVVYIHANPEKHQIISDFTKYKWSSWPSLVSGYPTPLLRDELFEAFGGKSSFIYAHRDTFLHYMNETSIEV